MFNNRPAIMREVWESDNGVWKLECGYIQSVPGCAIPGNILAETRKGAKNRNYEPLRRFHIVRRHGEEIECDAPGELPAYVVKALYSHIDALK